MIESTGEYVNFLIRENVTPNQYLLVYLLASDDTVNIYKYTEKGTPWKKSEVEDLVNRGIIILDETKGVGIERYSISEDMKSKLIVTNTDPGEQFWETYPAFAWIKGTKVPIKAVPREEFEKKYNEKVNKNLARHRRIMRALNYSKAHNQVNMRIDKWFDSEMWRQIEKELNRYSQVPVSND